MEDSTEGNLNSGGATQEVSEVMNSFKWPRDTSCHIFAKNVAAFSPCPKKFLEVKDFWINIIGQREFKTA